MKTSVLQLIIPLVVVGFLLACEAPQGDIGPNGPSGPAGDKGDKGPAGSQGSLSGVVSPWIEIKPSDWSLIISPTASTQLKEPALTQEIIDLGLVLVYYRPLPEDASSAVIALPDETNTYIFNYTAFVGSLLLSVNPTHNFFQGLNPGMEDWNIKVRYIIVPPAKAGRLARVNWKDYTEVKKALNLKD